VVGPAQTKDEARRLIAEAAFDVALLDGNLAGERVDDLALSLTRKGAPIVFLTGYGRQALPASFGHAPMVEKPFTHEQLLSALNSVLSRDDNVVRLKR
jgi:DNA-binding response OmpR family regulator